MKGDPIAHEKEYRWNGYVQTGFEMAKGDGDIVAARQLKSGKWRAYEAEYRTTYSHLHGGFCGHLVMHLIHDLSGFPIEAGNLDLICEQLSRLRWVQPIKAAKRGE